MWNMVNWCTFGLPVLPEFLRLFLFLLCFSWVSSSLLLVFNLLIVRCRFGCLFSKLVANVTGVYVLMME